MYGRRRGSARHKIMENNENYNLILTQQPFEGEFRRKRGAKIIYDARDKILGAVGKKQVFDLNGEEIGVFSRVEKRENSDGKPYKIRIYSADGENGFYICDGRFYSITGGDERLEGTYEVTERNPVRISALSLLAVFLALVIVFVTLINLPFDGRPVIDVRDVDGNWEGHGVVGVFDEKILPGSEGEYEFVIRNPYEVALDYSFALTPEYEGNVDINDTKYFPITFRLRMNNALIETDEWLTVDKLDYSELSMMPKSDQSFTLEWRWAFQSGHDYEDSVIGADGGKISIVLNLTARQGGNAL